MAAAADLPSVPPALPAGLPPLQDPVSAVSVSAVSVSAVPVPQAQAPVSQAQAQAQAPVSQAQAQAQVSQAQVSAVPVSAVPVSAVSAAPAAAQAGFPDSEIQQHSGVRCTRYRRATTHTCNIPSAGSVCRFYPLLGRDTALW